MNRKFVMLSVIAVCGLLILSAKANSQDFDPPEIHGPRSQEYDEIQIEITAIARQTEYQAYYRDTDIPRGKKLVADTDQEFAVVYLRTERLGENPAISLNGISIFDSDGMEHKGSLGGAFIGTLGDRRAFHPKVVDYEFTVLVPKGIVFATVQLRASVRRETQPYTVTQKINFDVSSLADPDVGHLTRTLFPKRQISAGGKNRTVRTLDSERPV